MSDKVEVEVKVSQFMLDVAYVLKQFMETPDPMIIYKACCVPVVCPREYAKEVLDGTARKRGDCIGMDYLAYNGDGGYVIKALKEVNPRLLPLYSRTFKVLPVKQQGFPCGNKEYYFYCNAVYQQASVMYTMMEDKKAA